MLTSIQHDLLKPGICALVHNSFKTNVGSVRYTHSKITIRKGYFTYDIDGGGDHMYTAEDIYKMMETLTDDMCLVWRMPFWSGYWSSHGNELHSITC